MPPVGDARERQSVKFYLVAMIFLLFDIEVAFLYPWAMALRDLGWIGFVQVLTFFALLATGYVYVWRKGAFDWRRKEEIDHAERSEPQRGRLGVGPQSEARKDSRRDPRRRRGAERGERRGAASRVWGWGPNATKGREDHG